MLSADGGSARATPFRFVEMSTDQGSQCSLLFTVNREVQIPFLKNVEIAVHAGRNARGQHQCKICHPITLCTYIFRFVQPQLYFRFLQTLLAVKLKASGQRWGRLGLEPGDLEDGVIHYCSSHQSWERISHPIPSSTPCSIYYRPDVEYRPEEMQGLLLKDYRSQILMLQKEDNNFFIVYARWQPHQTTTTPSPIPAANSPAPVMAPPVDLPQLPCRPSPPQEEQNNVLSSAINRLGALRRYLAELQEQQNTLLTTQPTLEDLLQDQLALINTPDDAHDFIQILHGALRSCYRRKNALPAS